MNAGPVPPDAKLIDPERSASLTAEPVPSLTQFHLGVRQAELRKVLLDELVVLHDREWQVADAKLRDELDITDFSANGCCHGQGQ